MPNVGHDDLFEQEYRARLKLALVPLGLIVVYEDDRAALDLGVHLFEGEPNPDVRVGNVRVWLQCKGLHSTKLSADQFAAADQVSIGDLKVEDVKFWYGSPEPVYLVVYIQAINDFLAEDVRVLVDRQGGMPDLARRSLAGQKTMTLKLRYDALLHRATREMPRHRSLRVDGPDWRGRPLGHRYDPLRSQLDPLKPPDFAALVGRLLEAHDFRPSRDIDIGAYLAAEVGQVTASLGKLYLTYEWTSPLFSEFGYDEGTDFRLESPPEHVHGDVVVIVHSDVVGRPRAGARMPILLDELRDEAIRLLVFFNEAEMDGKAFGAWRTTLGLHGTPQGLGSLAFNVLTATSVYMEFMDRLAWKYVNYR